MTGSDGKIGIGIIIWRSALVGWMFFFGISPTFRGGLQLHSWTTQSYTATDDHRAINDGMPREVMILLYAEQAGLPYSGCGVTRDIISWHSSYTLLGDGEGLWAVRISGMHVCVLSVCFFKGAGGGGLRELLRFNYVFAYDVSGTRVSADSCGR